MKHMLFAAAGCLAVIATSMPVDAEAQSLRGLRSAARDVKNTAKDAKEAKEIVEEIAGAGARGSGNGSSASGSGAVAGRPGPAPAELVAKTKCAGVPLENMMIGQVEDYTFQEGFEQEKRSGFINREQVSAAQGCIAPSMKTYDWLYMEVDEAEFAKFDRNAWEMQCMESRTKRVLENAQIRPSVNNMAGKDMMLYCGNSEGITECATGSNSDRSRAWDEKLAARGKVMVSFNMPSYHLDKGTDIYCQYYNKKSGTALVAFQWRRSKG